MEIGVWELTAGELPPAAGSRMRNEAHADKLESEKLRNTKKEWNESASEQSYSGAVAALQGNKVLAVTKWISEGRSLLRWSAGFVRSADATPTWADGRTSWEAPWNGFA